MLGFVFGLHMRPRTSELAVIEKIRRQFTARPSNVGQGLVSGIGDDAAVLQVGKNTFQVISSDAFIEGNHFLRRFHHPEEVGYKALARAVSDLAAMGAMPAFFLMNLALPKTCSEVWLNRFLQGMSEAAKKFAISLIGGDTTRPLLRPVFSVNLTVIGETRGYSPLLRSGAQPGDFLYISGQVGAAALGLEMVRRGQGRTQWASRILQKHLRPEPRLKLGAWLAMNRLATAMIDTSDGLSSDLANLCHAGRVGATVNWEKLPKVIVPSRLKLSPQKVRALCLHGGDDYELLFAVSPRNKKKIPPSFGGAPLTLIGQITSGKKLFIQEATGARDLHPEGWDPLRG